MFDPSQVYVKLAIIGAGLADGLIFDHISGAIAALIVLGILELCTIADDRAKRKRALEDELCQHMEGARASGVSEERRRRRAVGPTVDPPT
jgi:hypothetical protein